MAATAQDSTAPLRTGEGKKDEDREEDSTLHPLATALPAPGAPAASVVTVAGHHKAVCVHVQLLGKASPAAELPRHQQGSDQLLHCCLPPFPVQSSTRPSMASKRVRCCRRPASSMIPT